MHRRAVFLALMFLAMSSIPLFEDEVDDPTITAKILDNSDVLGVSDGRSSTTQTTSWTRTMGSNENDYGYHIETSGDGSVYVAGEYCTSGSSSCTMYFDNSGSASKNAQLSGRNSCVELFVAKYSPDGDLEWSEYAYSSDNCGSGYVYVTDLDVAPDGTAVISGYFRYTMYFGGQFNIQNDYSSYWDGFVAKIDKNGQWKWAHSYGYRSCCEHTYGEGVAIDPNNGDVYTTGRWYHTTHSFHIDQSNYFSSYCGSWIWSSFVLRFDSNGNTKWGEEIKGYTGSSGSSCNTNSNNEAWDIEIDNASNIYVTGYFRYCLEFYGTRHCGAQRSNWDGFMLKFDQNKTVDWIKHIGSNSDDYLREIAFDGLWNPVVYGYRSGNSISFGGGSTPSTNKDFVAKWNRSGSEEWVKDLTACCYNNNQKESGLSVSPTNGDVWIVHDRYEEIISGDGSTSKKYTTKTDDNGVAMWVHSVNIDANGTIYRAGKHQNTITLDGVSHSHRGSSYDLWISKFDPDDDGDGLPNRLDNCPLIQNSDQTNHDSDEYGDVCDTDDDNDGLSDTNDDCRYGDIDWISAPLTDQDGDGCRDGGEDKDDDNDGIEDYYDLCERNSFGHSIGLTGWLSNKAVNDHDEDGCHDEFEDDDDDNDGVNDGMDRCFRAEIGWGSNPLTDHDGDGCQDGVEDDDRDNDTIIDANDDCPLGRTNWSSTPSTDHDGDGCFDLTEDLDDDNDGIPDTDDTCPLGFTGWVSLRSSDHDRDGCANTDEDDDDDDDGVENLADLCPQGRLFRSSSTTDNDRDGCEDATEDEDDDNDRIPDHDDFCPDGETNWVSGRVLDIDGDGCRDAGEDDDDDDDGVEDKDDNCFSAIGWKSNPSSDFDGDGCNDSTEDTDDDNDGTPDLVDKCPYGEALCLTTQESVMNTTNDDENGDAETPNSTSVDISTNATNTTNVSDSSGVLENETGTNQSSQTLASKSVVSELPMTLIYAIGGIIAVLAIIGILLSRKGGKGDRESDWASEYGDFSSDSGGPPANAAGRIGQDGLEWVEHPPASGNHFYRQGPGGSWIRWAD